jgi:hypothetical protein
MSRRPMIKGRSPERGSVCPDPDVNITAGHVRALHMVTSGLYDDRIALWSCTINGEPGVAIVLIDDVSYRGQTRIAPLFVALTPGMKVEFDGSSAQESDGEDGEGAPIRGLRSARQLCSPCTT